MASAVTTSQESPFSTQKPQGQNDYQGVQNNQTFMKQKIERYYNLGVSLSKCLGLFDCVNFVQYLLNLLEEYELYIVMQNHAYIKNIQANSSQSRKPANK